MKQRLLIIALAGLLGSLMSSCRNAEKQLLEGDYDFAYDIALDRLSKGKMKDKEIILLEDAYELARQRDQQEIELLKMGNREDKYVLVYEIYEEMKYRQDRLAPFLPLFIEKDHRYAEFHIDDFLADMARASREASKYLYDQASRMLRTGDVYEARRAYDHLIRLQNIAGTYRNSGALLNQARDQGTEWVSVEIRNLSGPQGLPIQSINSLQTMPLNGLGDFWVQYCHEDPPVGRASFTATVRIHASIVSQDQWQELHYKESAEIGGGVRNSQDSTSSGEKHKIVHVDVTETVQGKEAFIDGVLELRDAQNKLLESIPLHGEAKFHNAFTRVNGDRRAMSEETKAKLDGGMVPYPSEYQMILDASVGFEEAAQRALRTLNL